MAWHGALCLSSCSEKRGGAVQIGVAAMLKVACRCWRTVTVQMALWPWVARVLNLI